MFLGDIALDDSDVENLFGETVDEFLDNVGQMPLDSPASNKPVVNATETPKKINSTIKTPEPEDYDPDLPLLNRAKEQKEHRFNPLSPSLVENEEEEGIGSIHKLPTLIDITSRSQRRHQNNPGNTGEGHRSKVSENTVLFSHQS